MSIRNVNPAYGDAVVMRSPAEMARLIQKCGYSLPDDGLKEGRDYEELSVPELIAEARRKPLTLAENARVTKAAEAWENGIFYSYHLDYLEDAING